MAESQNIVMADIWQHCI